MYPVKEKYRPDHVGFAITHGKRHLFSRTDCSHKLQCRICLVDTAETSFIFLDDIGKRSSEHDQVRIKAYRTATKIIVQRIVFESRSSGICCPAGVFWSHIWWAKQLICRGETWYSPYRKGFTSTAAGAFDDTLESWDFSSLPRACVANGSASGYTNVNGFIESLEKVLCKFVGVQVVEAVSMVGAMRFYIRNLWEKMRRKDSAFRFTWYKTAVMPQ